MTALYDTIGIDYAALRRPDPRIAAPIEAAIGDARTVVNVGAGTGSYEPLGFALTALEPSRAMIRQRATEAAPAVQGRAEALPFADASFDAAMAVLTVHHWADKAQGLAEMRRVSRGPVVLLTFDPDYRGAWLNDYLPELAALDDRTMPAMADYARWMGPVSVQVVPVPHNCTDGFLYAYWRRPRAYLDPRIRRGSSSFAMIDAGAGLDRLAADLESGTWERRYGHLLTENSRDMGYRLVVSAAP